MFSCWFFVLHTVSSELHEVVAQDDHSVEIPFRLLRPALGTRPAVGGDQVGQHQHPYARCSRDPADVRRTRMRVDKV